jgi:hypothetical protein
LLVCLVILRTGSPFQVNLKHQYLLSSAYLSETPAGGELENGLQPRGRIPLLQFFYAEGPVGAEQA